MSDDDTIEDRLNAASEQLVASFSNLDMEADLRLVRSEPPSHRQRGAEQWRRWLTVAAAVVLLAGGAAAIAITVAVRSGVDSDSMPPGDNTSAASPATPSAAPSTAPPASSSTPTTTERSSPVVPETSTTPTTVPESTGFAVEVPSDVFVTVSGDQAVIDVRSATDVVATVDLTCPDDLSCVIHSARVMGDTIWVAIADVQPDRRDAVVRSRVVSVSVASGEVVEHLSQDGSAAVRSAGRGADGVLYAYLDGQQQPAGGQLVAIDGRETQVLETGVSGFRLSDDGRLLAVSFSNPLAGESARFEIMDLVDQTTSEFQTSYVNAGPAAWSPDGRYLIVDEQWEDETAWVIDPWSGSGDPIAGTDRFLDGGCFMDDAVIAHRTWSVGYGQGDAQPGVIRLTSIATGSTVTELGNDLFGDRIHCHRDGSISYLSRPVVEVQLSPDSSQLEPDYDAPVELIRISADGTTTVMTSGDLRIV